MTVVNRYTVLTVVFPAEIELLKIQARSLAMYCDPSLVEQIIVVNNGGSHLSRSTTESLLQEYGALRPLVRIMQGDEVGQIPDASGWWTQQVIKLLIARQIKTERYLVLDAKSHLVSPLSSSFLEEPDGRATINIYSYATHPLREELVRTLAYFGLSFPQDERFTATVAPFTIYTDQALALIDFMEREGKPFAAEMLDRKLTEFFLYGAWLQRQGLVDRLYVDHQSVCPILWKRKANVQGVEEVTADAAEPNRPFFAVHRSAFAHLNRDAINLLADFWAQRGLFSRQDAARFIKRRRDADRRAERLGRLLDRAHRALGRLSPQPSAAVS